VRVDACSKVVDFSLWQVLVPDETNRCLDIQAGLVTLLEKKCAIRIGLDAVDRF